MRVAPEQGVAYAFEIRCTRDDDQDVDNRLGSEAGDCGTPDVFDREVVGSVEREVLGLVAGEIGGQISFDDFEVGGPGGVVGDDADFHGRLAVDASGGLMVVCCARAMATNQRKFDKSLYFFRQGQ